MVALSTHPMRALSPITELTTPTSLRTLQLPLDDTDYLSERIPRDSLDTARSLNDKAGDDDDDVSVYSQQSADTVREHRPVTSTPTEQRQRQRTVSLPGPNVPPRSPRRGLPTSPKSSKWNSSTSSLVRSVTPTLTSAPDGPTEDPKIPFPLSSTPALQPGPGGLPPPLRSTTSTASRPAILIKRVPPPTSPRRELYLDQEARKRLTEAFEPAESSDDRSISEMEGNMAGVGAGKSLSQPASRGPSRKSSFNESTPDPSKAGHSPAKLDISHEAQAQTQSPRKTISTYFNIPFIDLPPQEKNSPLPAPRSRPNSLKKRPKSYHGSRPGSQKSRPNSFHGSGSKGGISPGPASPVLGLDVGSEQVEKPAFSDEPAQTAPPSPRSTLRPAVVKRQSESSLPKRSDTARSASPSRRSSRRRRVSSIFSAIFGSTPDPEHGSRKLSKKSKTATTASTSDTSRGSSPPSPTSPTAKRLTETPITDEGSGPVQTAIRTSGTFGIRDDGSDVSKLPQSPLSPRAGYDRTESGDGSVITHSDGVKRVLYVENHVDTFGEENQTSSGDKEAFFTPMTPTTTSPVEEVLSLTNVPDGSAGIAITQTGERPELPHQQSFPPLVPSVGISYSSTHSLHRDHYGLGVLFPHQSHAPGHLTDRLLSPSSISPGSHLSPSVPISPDGLRSPFIPDSSVSFSRTASPTSLKSPDSGVVVDTLGFGQRTRPNSTSMVEESTQTSRQTSPSNTPRFRPLPHPPSRATSPLRTPEPTFIPPPPPETSPAADLPLLIASHLLSTHAAALMRHSSSMTEASETMRKMAKESLDWGGILMRMADKKPRSGTSLDGLPTGQEHPEASAYEGVPVPQSRFTSASASRPTLRPETFASYQHLPAPDQGGTYDPVREAYDHLTSLPPRLTVTRSAIRGESRRRKADSLPADLLEEAQRLGNEGWRSLHAAEAAWAGAMGRLSEMLEQEQFVETCQEAEKNENGSSESGYPRMGVASTLPPSSLSQSQSADSHDSIIVQPRSNAPTPMTTLSYPLGSPNTIPTSQLSLRMSPVVGHGRSFLPAEGDMMSPASTSAAVTAEGHIVFQHPASNVLHNEPMASNGHTQGSSEDTIRARPAAIAPSSSRTEHHHHNPPASTSPPSTRVPYRRTLVRLDHPFTQLLAAQFDHEVLGGAKIPMPDDVRGGDHRQAGYTNAALGLDAPNAGSSASHSHSYPHPQDRQRDRETPSSSTITSSSHIHDPTGTASDPTSTPTPIGTMKGTTKKLAKKKKLPLRGSLGTSGGSVSGFGSEFTSVNGNGDQEDDTTLGGEFAIAPTSSDGTMRKKYWWNRKRE
ncbi:hypothetical protein IAU59_001146 [Kwoniella sp. CBS 9459]